MKLKIIAAGGKMPGWVQQGYNEYAKRLPQEISLEVIEVPLGYRAKGQPAVKAIAAEGQAMLKQVSPADRVVALEVRGKAWDTEQLAEQLSGWQLSGNNCCLLIGGPDGLSAECLSRADQRWSLSPLTLPHPLVRVVLAEQIYRAWSINAGHPYHK